VKLMNRATADNQSAQSEEEGLEPTKEWVKDLIDGIIAEEFSSPDLELHWLDEDDGDPETVLESRVKLGAITLNEMRGHLGLDPYANPAADRPMVLTPTGYAPIEANAGGEGTNDSASGQSAKADTQSGKAAIRKASPDDPEHPGWPAGTPGGIGGQFRPKDGAAGDSSIGSADGAETRSVTRPSSSTADPQVAQTLPPPLLFEEPPLVVRPPLPEFPEDPTVPPGPGFEWRGQPGSQPGDPKGSWYNPETGETLRPDMNHPPQIPPHWDYKTPDKRWYRWFPDGRLELKS
jgi:hypothetical protein